MFPNGTGQTHQQGETFETVSAHADALEHKPTPKGLLVTASGFGQANEAFANGGTRPELDGTNLVHALKEHMDDVIPGPVSPGVGHDRCRAPVPRRRHLQTATMRPHVTAGVRRVPALATWGTGLDPL